MSNPNYIAAQQYAFRRIETELDSTIYYHNIVHTRDEVLPAVELFAHFEGVKGEPLLLLKTAAIFHDIGFIDSCDEHELAGVEITKNALPEFGYLPYQITSIIGMIMATRIPQSPKNTLEELLADADLAVFGNDDFSERNLLLRAEREAFGNYTSDEEWYLEQLRFLEIHEYFTVGARFYKNTGKTHNIYKLKSLMVKNKILTPP